MRVDIASNCNSLEAELVNAVLDHVGDGLTHELSHCYYLRTRYAPQ